MEKMNDEGFEEKKEDISVDDEQDLLRNGHMSVGGKIITAVLIKNLIGDSLREFGETPKIIHRIC